METLNVEPNFITRNKLVISNIKKHYIRYFGKALGFLMAASILISSIGAIYLGEKTSYLENWAYLLRISAYSILIVWSMCMAISMPQLLVELCDTGIKPTKWSKPIRWDKINRVTLTGTSRIPFLSTLTFEHSNKQIRVSIAIFEDQELLFLELVKYLPWLKGISAKTIPAAFLK